MTNDKTLNIHFHTQSSTHRGTLIGKLSHGSARQTRIGNCTDSHVLPPELLHKTVNSLYSLEKNNTMCGTIYTTQIPAKGKMKIKIKNKMYAQKKRKKKENIQFLIM